jgi:zinc transport system substrate-binding protein
MRQILLTRATRVFLFLLLTSALPQLRAADPPRVLASIQPIHSLAAMVMEGVAEPALFWTATQSPHDTHLRPSDVRKLHQADLVIWVGPELEMALEKPIRTLPAQQVLTLMQVPEIWRLPVRIDLAWAIESHGVDAHGHHHDATTDAHLWLSPRNAQVMVETIRDRLVKMDPARGETYRANTARALKRIQAVENKLHQQLASVREVPYLVFHDAYQYFELSFALNAQGAVQLSPERAAGARHLHALHEQIQQQRIRCLFSEPQFEPNQVHSLAARGDVRLGVLDPLGVELAPGADAWAVMMQNLGDDLVECLGASAPGGP